MAGFHWAYGHPRDSSIFYPVYRRWIANDNIIAFHWYFDPRHWGVDSVTGKHNYEVAYPLLSDVIQAKNDVGGEWYCSELGSINAPGHGQNEVPWDEVNAQIDYAAKLLSTNGIYATWFTLFPWTQAPGFEFFNNLAFRLTVEFMNAKYPMQRSPASTLPAPPALRLHALTRLNLNLRREARVASERLLVLGTGQSVLIEPGSLTYDPVDKYWMVAVTTAAGVRGFAAARGDGWGDCFDHRPALPGAGLMTEGKFPLPPPPPNTKERASKRRGRPPKTGRPLEQAHLPPEEPEQASLILDDGTIDVHGLLTFFLANVPADVLSRTFNVDVEQLRPLLDKVANETLITVDDLLETLTLKNIARTEHLMTIWYPLAMGGLEKAHKAVIDTIRMENELLKIAREEIAERLKNQQDTVGQTTAAAELISRADITLSKGDDLYNLAKSLGAGKSGAELEELNQVLAELAPQEVPGVKEDSELPLLAAHAARLQVQAVVPERADQGGRQGPLAVSDRVGRGQPDYPAHLAGLQPARVGLPRQLQARAYPRRPPAAQARHPTFPRPARRRRRLPFRPALAGRQDGLFSLLQECCIWNRLTWLNSSAHPPADRFTCWRASTAMVVRSVSSSGKAPAMATRSRLRASP